MHKRESWWVIGLFIGITSVFFYQTLFYGKIPFPGDALASDFQPWRSESYAGYNAGGIPDKAQYPDTIRQIYPWKTLVVESLKRGKLPLWNPYNFSGSPLLANFQSAALYPLNIFYLLLPQVTAWTLLIVLEPFLAAIFTYFYCRKINMSLLPSVMSALSYGFSGFMAVWLEYNTVGHVILWLPLFLLIIESLKEKLSAGWLGLLTLITAAALLSGHPQVFGYLYIFFLIYAYVRTDRKKFLWIVGFSFLGIGVSGLQLIPGIELISNAARSPHEFNNLFTKILIQPLQLLSLPFPNIFGNPATRTYWPTDTFVGKVTTVGLIPLFFAPSAIRKKDIVSRFFLWTAILVLILITANPVSWLLYKIPIPILNSSSPTLMAFLLAFALSVLCGLGLNSWLTDRHSINKFVRRCFEVAILFTLLVITVHIPFFRNLSEHSGVALRALLYGFMLSAVTLVLFGIAIKLPKYRTHAIAILLIAHTLDLLVFFNRFNPFVPQALVFPRQPVLTYLMDKGPDRYWGYATANIAANFASQYHMFSPEGYDPLYPIWYGQFLYSYRSGKSLQNFDTTTRSDAAITSHFGDGGLSDANKQRVLNMLGVRYVVDRAENASDEKIFPISVFTKIYTYKDWSIYENKNAMPRAYLNGGTATIKSYEPERVVIQTESTASGMLTLSDTYYPGWSATVDGEASPINRIQMSFRGVNVPQGKHLVTFVYAPKSITYGAMLSIFSILATIALMIIANKNSSRTYE